MQKIDRGSVPPGPDEIRLFAVVRNEALRLPAWIRHYRRLGIDRFFVVDNESSDGTVPLLLNEPNVHVFRTGESFHDGRYGRLWIAPLMEEHGEGRWCVVADGDELLAPPHWERVGLREVTALLDAEGSEALPCLLLDLYSDRPLREMVLPPEGDPLELFPYFDPDFDAKDARFVEAGETYPFQTWVGSTRRKIFGINPYLSKVGMLKFRPGMVLTSGQHGVVGARLSQVRGVMFHLKFLADFVERVEVELERDERRTHTQEWVAYAEAIRRNPRLSLHDHRSVRLKGSRQLLDLGLMKTTPDYEAMMGPPGDGAAGDQSGKEP